MDKHQTFDEAISRTLNSFGNEDGILTSKIAVTAIDEFIALCKYHGVEIKDYN